MRMSMKSHASVILLCVLILVGSTIVEIEALPQKGTVMLGIAFTAAIFWGTEIVPIPVTALLIVFLQAILGISTLEEGFSYLGHPVNLLLLIGFTLASGLKKYELDQYISKQMILAAGTKVSRLLLGVMTVVAFLSMWIANTSTTAIMVPIVVKMLNMMKEENPNIGRSFLIGIAYAGTIGGIATPIGTTPNPITIGFLQDMADIHLTFLDWLLIGLPFVILLIPISWLLLLFLFPPEKTEINVEFFEREPFPKHPGVIRYFIVFGLVIFLWFFGSFFDVTEDWLYLVSLLGVILMHFPPLGTLHWKQTAKDVDWGVLLLIGGGLSLGNGLMKSGVVDWVVAILMHIMGELSIFFIVLIIAAITGTSILFFCSITATSTAFVPVAITLALQMGVNPIPLAAAAGVASSFAYFLPANTPPNAIAYSEGRFQTKDMMKAGSILLILSVGVFGLIYNLLWRFIFF